VNIGELYSLNSAKLKDKMAVICEDQSLTHSQFEKRTNQFANALCNLGFQKGDRIAILSKNCLEYPEIIFGSAKAGVPFVPINYRMVEREVVSLLAHCKPKGIIFSPDYKDLVLSIQDKIEVENYILLEDGGEITNSKIEPLNYNRLLQEQSAATPSVKVEGSDVYYIGYTSGTTGRPKGSILTHGSRCMLGLVISKEFNIGPGDIQLIPGPIYHSAPHAFLLSQLLLGGTVIIMKDFQAEGVLKLTAKYGATNMFMAPTMYNFILELDEQTKQKYQIESVKTLISAGAPLPTRIKEGIITYFYNAGLYEFYGATEAGLNITLRPEDQMKTIRSVGKPVLFNDIKILNDAGEEVAQGEIGEIYVHNPYHFIGYLQDEEETKKVFRGDHVGVGDLAYQDENGFYYIVDRKKDMVISGGVNIFPAEIEDVLYQHPDVKEVAVIGIPDEKWGESLKAYIVPRRMDVQIEEILNHCKQHLASYKKPKSIELVEDLPRNAAGKILKRELRDKYWKSTYKVQ
jgi:long-chain acyl-CoA synthetase